MASLVVNWSISKSFKVRSGAEKLQEDTVPLIEGKGSFSMLAVLALKPVRVMNGRNCKYVHYQAEMELKGACSVLDLH